MKNNMVWDAIVVALCVYLAYGNVRSLMAVPFGEWTYVHYLLVVVSLGLVAVAVLRGVSVYKAWQRKKNGEEEEPPAENADGQQPAEGGTTVLEGGEATAATQGEEGPTTQVAAPEPPPLADAEEYLDEMTPEEARRMAAAKQADLEKYGDPDV